MAKVHIEERTRTTKITMKKRDNIFKSNNKVANCPICGKFYNSKKK